MPYDALRKGRVAEPCRAYLVTTVTHQRQPVFREFSLGRMVVREMRRIHDGEEVISLAWVIMPDHLHWLVQLPETLGLEPGS